MIRARAVAGHIAPAAVMLCLGCGSSDAATGPGAADAAAVGFWKPPVRATWQWQLSGTFDPSIDAEIYDLDAEVTDAATVASLRDRGKRTICYLSAGSFEDYRADASSFPPEIIGKDYEGWAGEKWLDVRALDKLGPILRARMQTCKDKGFDAVEPDNVDGYSNDTGFPLTADDQLAFNRWLAATAHDLGLGIGLKNDADQAAELAADFDWALTEDCAAEGWCEEMSVFVGQAKPVLVCEYTDTGATTAGFCPTVAGLQMNGILKKRELDAWREACP